MQAARYMYGHCPHSTRRHTTCTQMFTVYPLFMLDVLMHGLVTIAWKNEIFMRPVCRR
jgi:hypothetical protein